jgi:signal transduction histidine kinase
MLGLLFRFNCPARSPFTIRLQPDSRWRQAAVTRSHLETTIFRIVQEALTNVFRHSEARDVSRAIHPIDRRQFQFLRLVPATGLGM